MATVRLCILKYNICAFSLSLKYFSQTNSLHYSVSIVEFSVPYNPKSIPPMLSNSHISPSLVLFPTLRKSVLKHSVQHVFLMSPQGLKRLVVTSPARCWLLPPLRTPSLLRQFLFEKSDFFHSHREYIRQLKMIIAEYCY